MSNESGLAPVEYNLVIRMDPVEEKTASGLYLPSTKTDRDELEADEGVIVAMSPLAFSYAEWPEGTRLPQVGDRVLMARFDGRIWKRGSATYRLIKDKSVIAVVEQSAALAAAA
jgi:co-chaperonin GroES (HSP10)